MIESLLTTGEATRLALDSAVRVAGDEAALRDEEDGDGRDRDDHRGGGELLPVLCANWKTWVCSPTGRVHELSKTRSTFATHEQAEGPVAGTCRRRHRA
jgi:hypothetical protein